MANYRPHAQRAVVCGALLAMSKEDAAHVAAVVLQAIRSRRAQADRRLAESFAQGGF